MADFNFLKKKNNIIHIKELDNDYRIEIKLKRFEYPIDRNTLLRLKISEEETILVKVLKSDTDNKIIIAKKFHPCIYAWTTESLKLTNAYKVGIVNWQSVTNRLKQTDTTGIIEPIELVEQFQLELYDLSILDPKKTYEIESEIHETNTTN